MIPAIATIIVAYAVTRLAVAAFQYAATPGVKSNFVILVSLGVVAATVVMGFCLAGVYSIGSDGFAASLRP